MLAYISGEDTNVKSVGPPLGSGFITSSVTSARRRLASDRRVAVAVGTTNAQTVEEVALELASQRS